MCEIKFPNTTLEIANAQLKKTENKFIADAKDSWEQIIKVFDTNAKYDDAVEILFIVIIFILFASLPLIIFNHNYLLYLIINVIVAIPHIICGILKIKSDIEVKNVCNGEPSKIIADAIEKYRYQCPKEKAIDYINSLRGRCRQLLAEGRGIDSFGTKYLTFGERYAEFLDELRIIDSLRNVDTKNLKVTKFYIEQCNIPCVKIEENIKNKFSKTYNIRLALDTFSEADAENLIRNNVNSDNIIIDLSYIDKIFANVKL